MGIIGCEAPDFRLEHTYLALPGYIEQGKRRSMQLGKDVKVAEGT